MDELSKECQELSQTIFQHYLNKKLSLCVNLHNIMIFSAQGLFWRKIG